MKHKYLVIQKSTMEVKSFDDERDLANWVWEKDSHDFVIIKYERYIILLQGVGVGEMITQLMQA